LKKYQEKPSHSHEEESKGKTRLRDGQKVTRPGAYPVDAKEGIQEGETRPRGRTFLIKKKKKKKKVRKKEAGPHSDTRPKYKGRV